MSDNFNFEKALEELNSIVEKMEKGELPLEEAIKHFEKGSALSKQCQKTLKDAEQKIKLLSTPDESLENYEAD